MSLVYNKYSTYLQSKYGTKVYKLPVNLPVTCPNRDGKLSKGGCSFCSELGAGYECLSGSLPVYEQLSKNKSFISKKYKAEKFIAYFQNYTNTYLPIEKFKEYIYAAAMEDIVEIAISTRPDCINDAYINFLKEFKKQTNINITIELGLQSANYHTLTKISRGHTLAEYIDACSKIKSADLNLCTHVILNLPWDNILDVIETSKIVSALKNDYVKLHALYIDNSAKMAQQYKRGEFQMCSLEEYVERVIIFLEYLNPSISIQRLIGRAPEENTCFSNWSTSWWKIKDAIENKMENENRIQGSLFNYLNGKCL